MPPKKSAATAAAVAATPTPTSPTTATAPGDTSILSTTTAEPKSPTTSKSRKSQSDDIGIDDLTLPRSLTSRIARGILPPNTSLQKDAILAITKSATVFISALASEANEQTSRKTIQAGDVLKALREMELDGVMKVKRGTHAGTTGGGGGGNVGDGSSRIEKELEMFETSVRGKRKGYREKVKQRESGISDSGLLGASTLEGRGEGGDDGEREAKRVRRESQDDEEDEEDLLNRQLNGGNGVNGHGHGHGGGDESMVDVDGEERENENDETEDDPDAHDEEEGDDEEPEDEDDEGNESGDEDRVDVEESPQKKNRYVLAPDGRAEVGSEDESD